MTKLIHHIFICVVILLYSTTTVVSQQRVGSSLANAMQEPEPGTHRVVVYLNEKADLILLEKALKRNNIPVKNRPQLVKNALVQVADRTQNEVIDAISDEFALTLADLNPKRLWINNCFVISAHKELILFLSDMDAVELVDLETARMVRLLDPPRRATVGEGRTPGAAEPGLLAIGAHHLWNMGYTGNNRMAYSIDTGVWPDHPAIRSQYMVNHVPLHQAWFGYDSEFPMDKSSDHGTHTIGTTLGLDHDTHDTIGVAFNAYYIASDPVATSLATVKPLTDFMFAFEWAFDPDGDPATTDDIPDVINNSWGYDVPTDDELCESYASEMFTAIQAAGIANVMSAGNSGPGPMTIGIPHHLNTGLVNTFTVGAVNAHIVDLPIAGFSSRGPTICGGTGSIEIKPEVVAPGVAVRSAIRNGEYDSYQGTSMAAPHVSGAVLLLREAFPNVSGEEILLALYNSAIDLGDVGEDNHYGNGMINVLEAFNLLSQSHTPTPPDSFTLDLSISAIEFPEAETFCGSSFQPNVKLTNVGSDTIYEADLVYSIYGEAEQNHTWTGILEPGTSTSVQLPAITVSSIGYVELFVKSTVAGGAVEADSINNDRVFMFNHRPQFDLPYWEDFETGNLHNGTWQVKNPDAHFTWDTVAVGGLDWSHYSVQMDFSAYTPIEGQNDDMISPVISLPQSESAQLKFDMSYSFVHSFFSDSLEVLLSTDCGDSWSTIYLNGGETLGLPDSLTDGESEFLPSLPEHWRTESVPLDNYMGEDILLNFRSKNDRGSHLVIDNIRVFTNEDPAGSIDQPTAELMLYPNPANNSVMLKTDVEIVSDIRIMDLTGRILLHEPSVRVNSVGTRLDVSELEVGTYLVQMTGGASKLVRPLVIAR